MTRPNRFLETFADDEPKATLGPPPVWLMRQAGRYLPEYRAVREQAGGFLDLCYNPELAAEVTLQPVRRFDLDAAILFSDILIVPHALGQNVWFEPGEGPRLESVDTAEAVASLSLGKDNARIASICETVRQVRTALDPGKALIGFCGAPWTVATYMIGGRGSPDQATARDLAYRAPETMRALIDCLVAASITYLRAQVEAGADAVQIFDTWAGSLPEDQFDTWVTEPTARIVAAMRESHPDIPIIGFPRQAGTRLATYASATGVDGVGCDTTVTMAHAVRDLPGTMVLQGNLDPLLLVAGGKAMAIRVDDILKQTTGRRFIFNLGHGIVPHTPPDHVAELIHLIRNPG